MDVNGNEVNCIGLILMAMMAKEITMRPEKQRSLFPEGSRRQPGHFSLIQCKFE